VSELDVIGTLYGTDKSSVHGYAWDFLRHYEQLIQKWKSEPINIIEIGVKDGASLNMWLRFFEKANVIGIDIDPKCKQFQRDRAIIEIGSQEDPGFLHEVAAKYKPTIVIDDGSHLAHHMIASFEALFPALCPGGVYILEDMSMHFADGVNTWKGEKGHQGDSDKSIYDYIAPFFRARLANLNVPRGCWGFTRYAFENIDSITAFGGALAITKRGPRPIEQDMAVFEGELTNFADKQTGKLRYAMYLIKHNKNDRAGDTLKEILTREPGYVPALEQLYVVEERLGHLEASLDCAERIAKKQPNVARSWMRVADAQRSLRQPLLELAALKHAIDIDDRSILAHRRISILCQEIGDLPSALAEARKACSLSANHSSDVTRVKALETMVAKK
jgi:hypothetical protein